MKEALACIGGKIKQHAPEILVTTGIILTGASTVAAVKLTPKCKAIKEQKEEELKAVDECLALNDPKYTQKDAKKDLTIINTKSTINTIKVYLPAIALFSGGVICILSGMGILKKRNSVLASFGILATEKLKKYRKNVAEKYGEDVEKELYYGIKEMVVEKEGEKGKTKKVKAMDNTYLNHDEYCKFFDESSSLYDGYDPLNHNKIAVLNAQKNCNYKIRGRVKYDKDGKVLKPGYLFLNEAYHELGLDKTAAGQVIGWLYNPEEDGPIDETHRYIDFGLFRDDQATRDFMNNKEKSVLLDFNVDGPISHLCYENMDTIKKLRNRG